jgi:hypothetical protein
MLDSLLTVPGSALRYLVEHDAFAVVQPLNASSFVTFCNERGVRIDVERLERLERLGIFYPLARIEYPRINVKVERVGTDRVQFHGMLKEGETWDGELREENSRFSWRRDWALSWIEHGSLWDPRERAFQPWKTFRRKGSFDPRIESFYSPFQAFVLHSFLHWITMRIFADDIALGPLDEQKFMKSIVKWAKDVTKPRPEHPLRSTDAAFIAQVLSNRYHFHTRGDRRTIRVSEDPFEPFEWREFCRQWDARAVVTELGLTDKELADIHVDVSFLASAADPIERWYKLVSFMSVEKREQLKDEARFAQLGYSIELMLRMFYKDAVGKELRPPDERHAGIHVKEQKDNASLLKELEYLVNRYNLNPKPQLILVVEGDGEARELPRLALELLGVDFAQLGIEVRNLRGIVNFTGAKGRDPYSALEKFIDDHHFRQTIVFCILDREGRAAKTRERLVGANSVFVPGRKLTCPEYVHLWADSIEFDNFTDEEIAEALTRVSEDRYTFRASEVGNARVAKAKKGNPLNTLYQSILSYDLNKVQLLHELFSAVIAGGSAEHKAKPPRPVIGVLNRVIDLAAQNHQPVGPDLWEHNQRTGYFGPLIASLSSSDPAAC